MTDITGCLQADTRRRRSVLRLISAVLSLKRQRRVLAHLDATQLADIGLDAAAAKAEARRPAWDVPSNWRL